MTRFKTLSFEAAVLGACALLMAPGLTIASTVPPAAAVTIGNFTFKAPVLTVRTGATVTWTNGDDIPHTIVSRDGLFRSKVLDTGDHFSFTFAKPGQFGYFCSLHPHMTGTIIVTA